MDSAIIEIVIFIILIFIICMLSASEIAIASFGSNKIEELKGKNDKSAEDFEFIQNNSDSFFGTIQFITYFVLFLSTLIGFHLIYNFLSTTLSNLNIHFITDHLFFVSTFIIAGIFSLITLIFAVLIPKAIGFKYSEDIGKGSVKTLIILTGLIKYPVTFISKAANSILSIFDERTSFSQTRLSEDEIRTIISEGVETGALDETEKEIIDNVFEFNDLRAYDIMIPRTEMVGIELNDDPAKIRKEILNTNHTIIPVFENNIDNILGVLHTKDIIKFYIENKNLELHSLIRPVYFVPDKKLISEILKEMRKRGDRLAIITDEYGGTEGIISMEDIVEVIVGEFPEDDTKAADYMRMPDGNYIVYGSMEIEDFNKIFNFELPYSDEYSTIAGFVSYKTGKILNPGESFNYGRLVFELVKKIKQRMLQFKVYSLKETFYEKHKKKEA